MRFRFGVTKLYHHVRDKSGAMRDGMSNLPHTLNAKLVIEGRAVNR